MATCSVETNSSEAYWDVAAETYDRDFTQTTIGRMWRESAWTEFDTCFQPGQRLLELNCGTGVDAVHLAGRGIRVLACDISPRMIQLARKRAVAAGYCGLLDFRVLATEMIGTLDVKRQFDGAYSNFSGLNCVEDLSAVRRDLARLLKPGARIVLCMLGRFSVWELFWRLVHGHRKNLLRRLSKRDGIVKVRYLSTNEIAQEFAPEFQLRRWKGIGVTLPPPYTERWARRFPRFMQILASLDRVAGNIRPVRSIASCILLELQRTEIPGAG